MLRLPQAIVSIPSLRINGMLVLLCAAACGLPRDPDGTLERVRGGVLRVGVATSPPWVVVTSEGAAGVEPTLVKAIADSLGARIEWIREGESELLSQLADRKLDLVLAGLTDDVPWRAEVAFTRPYYDDPATKKRHVMAAPPGENAWLVFVERQLHRRRASIPDLVRSAE